MDELLETVTTAESSHEGFRVWITTEAHNQFPISLLQVPTDMGSTMQSLRVSLLQTSPMLHRPLQKRERTGKEYGCFPFV